MRSDWPRVDWHRYLPTALWLLAVGVAVGALIALR
jgi:hypothetical protein